ncbi:L,D-transpeptidase family protein [Geomonas subterranea]|uniref:L,D-transpeptidase family protein n=2 Tax=Geomonas subterranea TaxID=2847989 RepID=A0ABX8LJ48_9BACT|nr:L,D-transpeptidase family protein [Geomonas subterranea]QXM11111.1 L,D-transpeptidase family protein [Geomonas subterranea]
MACHLPLVHCVAVSALVLPALLVPTAQPAVAMPPVYAEGFIGEMRQHKVRPRESLIEIARTYDLGYIEIRDANPGVDPVLPTPGTVVTIPSAWIPPAVLERPAIVVNLAEMRLYFFTTKDDSGVLSFPIGIGDVGTDTPVGKFVVAEKLINPSWHVPESIRRQNPQLPRIIAPGVRNPLGRHALRLSRADILIHGTNRPWGIGRRSSHGCLRLYTRDMAILFGQAKKGTQVWIVSEPVKVGVKGRRVFIELHCGGRETPGLGEILHALSDRGLLQWIDLGKLVRAYYENKGYPIDISWADRIVRGLAEPPGRWLATS